MSRSEAVAQAIEEYVGRLMDQDEARTTKIDQLSEKLDRQADRLAKIGSNAELAAGMTTAALRFQFSAIDQLGIQELRRRAINERPLYRKEQKEESADDDTDGGGG